MDNDRHANTHPYANCVSYGSYLSSSNGLVYMTEDHPTIINEFTQFLYLSLLFTSIGILSPSSNKWKQQQHHPLVCNSATWKPLVWLYVQRCWSYKHLHMGDGWVDQMEPDWSRLEFSIKVHKYQVVPLNLNGILLNGTTTFSVSTKTHQRDCFSFISFDSIISVLFVF